MIVAGRTAPSFLLPPLPASACPPAAPRRLPLFLVETFVPDQSGFADGQRVQTKRLDMTTVWLEAARHDPVRQLLEYQRIRITQDGIRMVPLPMRYAWPSEMDLMARLAGLSLRDRWGGWDRRPFDTSSKMHVSVYQK